MDIHEDVHTAAIHICSAAFDSSDETFGSDHDDIFATTLDSDSKLIEDNFDTSPNE